MKKVFACLFIISFLLQSAVAQNNESNIREKSLGISFILNDFNTPQLIRNSSLARVFRDKSWTSLSKMSPGVALTYFNGLTSHIDFAGTLAMSFVNYPFPNKAPFSSDALLVEADASANIRLLSNNYAFSPYFIIGVGASEYKAYYGAIMPVGAGLNLNLFNEASVYITMQYRIPVTTATANYHFMATIGVSGILGKKTPAPIKIVETPQPKDTDGDGINDDVDQCPTVPGIAKYHGCPIPDTDKDGINDEEDQCPTVPGVAKYHGCPIPDTDGDGINDEEDKCPTIPGVARYQGCPVPDTDNDGVNDEEDKCPTVPGPKENNGCPVVKEEVIKKMDYAAKRIYFITGSAKLSSKSNAALNEVVKIMNDDPSLKLSIEGHTDNIGKENYNQMLSEKRATSVSGYLVNKGIDKDRLTSKGFGKTQPIADNKTAAGRAKNRRVVMKPSY